MCIPVGRQRLGKRIPATHMHATIGNLQLGNGPVNTFPAKACDNNRETLDKQRRGKEASSTIQVVFRWVRAKWL
jgi:hypothetical protein